MATLNELKSLLKAAIPNNTSTRQLTEEEYNAGFKILSQGATTYKDFIIPQLSNLLTPFFHSRSNVSVLEIGPGPKSVLKDLPAHLRQKIGRYAAFEPNASYASELEEWCKMKRPFPGLDTKAEVQCTPFDLDAKQDDRRFDLVLFCHSMYGMEPKRAYTEKAMTMLKEGGLVVVFHRDGKLHFDGLVCHQTTSSPTDVVHVASNGDVIDSFAPFIAGCVPEEGDVEEVVRSKWLEICRSSRMNRKDFPFGLTYSSPNSMVVFNQYANKLPELLAKVPSVSEVKTVKNPEARFYHPAAIVRPTEISHVQQCVKWALKYNLSLTVLGGGHSGQCLRNDVVAIDMAAFNDINIVQDPGNQANGMLAVVGAGCKSGDIISRAMDQGLTVPLGARPSVGAGLWLQGGIGHLARLHGLACDSIVGAVLVSVKNGDVLTVGNVPEEYRPSCAGDTQNQEELLWALKGAGTGFGVVVSVVFKTYPAPEHSVRSWVAPQSSKEDACPTLRKLEATANELEDQCSLDFFLYYDNDQLQLGATLYDTGPSSASSSRTGDLLCSILGESTSSAHVDGVQLFETDMYVSGMHGGHGGGKTSAFKRCIFLRDVGQPEIANALVTALGNRPTQMSYMHLLHGAGAVSKVAPEATAFGCRDWDYACVITGVWKREQDNTRSARDTVQWVYGVAKSLRLFSSGAYGADLGQDPRDVSLAADAFGGNSMRLARLKSRLDPHDILPFVCPLPKISRVAKLIVLVTGEVCVGKDYCAAVWAERLREAGFRARVESISEVTKKEYAAANGVPLDRLLQDRVFKEDHRPALTKFYLEQLVRRPWLAEEHFLNIVHSSPGVDVLFVTGMRDEAPVANFSHLVPHSKLIEVNVTASEQNKQARGGFRNVAAGPANMSHDDVRQLEMPVYLTDLTFRNDTDGMEPVRAFAKKQLVSFFDPRKERLADMVRSKPDFPQAGVEFRHILGISQHPGGLSMCTSLIEDTFIGDWSKIDAIVSCESGGFIFGSSLSARRGLPLILVREAGKLPPPTVSFTRDVSHISALDSHHSRQLRVEMDRDSLPRGGSVVVIDDALATGKTLVGILRLLQKAGVRAEQITVMVVAEFPVHQGRKLLQQEGFGNVRIQSLLVFGGK